MIEKTCAIIVRRPDAAPAEISAKLEAVIRMGCACFLSGLEYGAGLTAAEAVLQHKADRPCLTLECVIPYEEYYDTTFAALVYALQGYETGWSVSAQSKDIISAWLLNYSDECRNEHLHKENIMIS